MPRLIALALFVLLALRCSAQEAPIMPTRHAAADTPDGDAPAIWVFRPEQFDAAPVSPRRGILLIHGGGFRQGAPSLMYPLARRLAAGGLDVAVAQYQLTKGGGTLQRAITDTWACLDLAARTWEMPAGRIAVLGESAGGYLAACLALRIRPDDHIKTYPPAPRCGPTILVNAILDVPASPIAHKQPGLQEHADSRDAPDSPWRRLSPQHRIQPDLPPILLMHGDMDPVVPVAHSRVFAQSLLDSGNPVQLSILAGARHAFLLDGYGPPADVERGSRQVERFLADHGFLDRDPAD